MKSIARIFYHPTFKGDTYSLAAALAALQIYKADDIPERIERFGRELMDSINRLSRQLGINGEMVGLSFRMVYRFNEPDEFRRTWMRTLLHQELLKGGILSFRGFLLPSAAHGEAELRQTVSAFEMAFQVLGDVSRQNSFETALEIPPVR